MVFRKATHELYSTSFDRSLIVWNLEIFRYREIFYGHQDAITSMDALTWERCVTTGGRDKTLRVWKINTDSQLVFRHDATVGSLESVVMLDEDHYITGSDTG